MVLHRIANPDPSGCAGSIPACGVFYKMPEIYQPAEDSYLMSNHLQKILPVLIRKNPNLKFLEIGVGSGIQLETALKVGVKKENIFGTDINNKSVEHCKNLGFKCIQSNLFEKIPKQKFDIIVFNPPYLPKDKKEPRDSRVATTGGKKGNEIIKKFLKQAKKYLNKNGRIFLIASSLAEKIDFNCFGYKSEKIISKKLFFEILSLWELKR